uniref:Uncharacterized protein n=1 Tax=Romanomermis culicivorax TaxID=13658 RepID=A0A915HKX5_ROMCU
MGNKRAKGALFVPCSGWYACCVDRNEEQIVGIASLTFFRAPNIPITIAIEGDEVSGVNQEID